MTRDLEVGARDELADELANRVFTRLEELDVLPEDLAAEEATEAVLCVLCGRLDQDDARALDAAVPEQLREIVQRCPAHHAEQGELLGEGDLIHDLARHLHITVGRADALARAVFTAIRLELPPEDLAALEDHFTPDLRELWAIRRAA